MLGVSEIFKRRAEQNVFSQSARKSWMQVHQRTVRWTKPEMTAQTIQPFKSLVVGVQFYPSAEFPQAHYVLENSYNTNWTRRKEKKNWRALVASEEAYLSATIALFNARVKVRIPPRDRAIHWPIRWRLFPVQSPDHGLLCPARQRSFLGTCPR